MNVPPAYQKIKEKIFKVITTDQENKVQVLKSKSQDPCLTAVTNEVCQPATLRSGPQKRLL